MAPTETPKGPRWENTWSKIHARALVTKAILRKMNVTPLFMARHRRGSVKKRSFAESVESDAEVGFDASDDGFPDSSDGGQIEKRRRGRPFKRQIPGEVDINEKPLREIFVSRRRKVTDTERDDALKSAYTFASRLKSSTTFVVVMRQSFVYFGFILGVPKRFANRYMPESDREVVLLDEEWTAWYCAWNAKYNYIRGDGWRNFALMHCIEEDDAVLMEILEDSELALKIKVRIFRVVPIPEGVTGWDSHVCPPNSCMNPNSGVPIEPILF